MPCVDYGKQQELGTKRKGGALKVVKWFDFLMEHPEVKKAVRDSLAHVHWSKGSESYKPMGGQSRSSTVLRTSLMHQQRASTKDDVSDVSSDDEIS